MSSLRSIINKRVSPRGKSLAKRKIVSKKKEVFKSTVNKIGPGMQMKGNTS